MTTAVASNSRAITMTLTECGVRKAVTTYTLSERFMNTLLRTTVANILYHRLNIDKKEFVTKTFNTTSFKTVRSKSRNILLREYHGHMRACKDALEKNYLKNLYLFFINKNSGEIVENYKFTFKYGEKNQPKPKETNDAEELVATTTTFLETLNELKQHKKISSEIELKVEFTYFDDTPENYEPPGFKKIDESDALLKRLEQRDSVVLGSFFTGFHKFKCMAKGGIFTLPSTQESVNCLVPDANGSQNRSEHVGPSNSQNTNTAVETLDILTEDQLGNENQNAFSFTERAPDQQQKGFDETYMSQLIEVSSDSEQENIQCPCKLPSAEQVWTPDIIRCTMCNRKCHAPCQGYIDKTFLRCEFACDHCRSSENIVCSNGSPHFPASTSLCRIRYLVACLYKNSSPPRELESVFQTTFKKIKSFNVFQTEGNTTKFNRSMLTMLFDCNYKEPDLERIVNIPVLPRME